MKKLDLRKQDDSNNKNILNRANLKERREETKGNILEIMKKDFHSCFKNPIVILLMLGIILLPSLYGLVNIYACWNPYEETSNLQFAIANEDNGSKYQEYKVNAGEDLVSSLKENDDFDWVFVSSDELRNGVHDGKYYAGIIIPANFSESIVSITTKNPHSAELEYYVNEKSNPVAAKLSDAAAKTIYNKLNAEIVSFIDVAAYGKLEELQEGLASGADKMETGADKLAAGADKVGEGADELSAGANKVSSGADQLSTGATTLSQGAVKLANGADQVASGSSQVADGTQQIADKANTIYDIYLKIRKIIKNNGNNSKLSDDVDKLHSDTSKIAQELDDLYKETETVSSDAVDLYSKANYLSDDAGDIAVKANNIANRTHEVSSKFNNVSNHISELNQAIKENQDQSVIDDLLEKIDKEMNETNQKVNDLNNGAHLVANGSGSVATGASQLAGGSSKLASGANNLSSGVHVLADGTIKLADGAELLGYSSASALRNASDSIGAVADQLSDVTGLSDQQVGDYFFSPVKLERHEEFSTNNYGSQVAPFYLVLSMWVGALINTVMLKTGSSVNTKYKPHEVYMGKLLLFNVMTLLQTTVTLIGCFILGIDISNPLLFILTCYFVSIAFMAIIYSLASLFGEVGKGLAILLLVFQISGSGGVYPVEIMNTIFGILYPYLPMTHGINIVRESELGLIWANYLPSFAYLLIMASIIILIALVLKQRWDKRTKYFEEKLEESDLFN